MNLPATFIRQRARRISISRDDGFTLVELLISICLIGILFTGGYKIFVGFSKRTTETDLKNILMKEVRTLVEHIKRDVKACYGTDPALIGSTPPTPPISLNGTAPFSWKFKDNTGTVKQVEYSIGSDGSVTRNVDGSGKVVARYIKTLEITPNDSDSNGSVEDIEAATIKINVEAEFVKPSLPLPLNYKQSSVSVIDDLASKAQNKGWRSNFNP